MLPILVSSAQRFPWPSCSIPNLKSRHGFIKDHQTGKPMLCLYRTFLVLTTPCNVQCLLKEDINMCTVETRCSALLPEEQLPQQLKQLLWWSYCTRLPNVDSKEPNRLREIWFLRWHDHLGIFLLKEVCKFSEAHGGFQCNFNLSSDMIVIRTLKSAKTGFTAKRDAGMEGWGQILLWWKTIMVLSWISCSSGLIFSNLKLSVLKVSCWTTPLQITILTENVHILQQNSWEDGRVQEVIRDWHMTHAAHYHLK